MSSNSVIIVGLRSSSRMLGILTVFAKVIFLYSNVKEKGSLYFFVLIFKQNFTLSHVPQRKEKDCLRLAAPSYRENTVMYAARKT